MSADVDTILELLVPDYVNRHVLMKHDVARAAKAAAPDTP